MLPKAHLPGQATESKERLKQSILRLHQRHINDVCLKVHRVSRLLSELIAVLIFSVSTHTPGNTRCTDMPSISFNPIDQLSPTRM